MPARLPRDTESAAHVPTQPSILMTCSPWVAAPGPGWDYHLGFPPTASTWPPSPPRRPRPLPAGTTPREPRRKSRTTKRRTPSDTR